MESNVECQLLPIKEEISEMPLGPELVKKEPIEDDSFSRGTASVDEFLLSVEKPTRTYSKMSRLSTDLLPIKSEFMEPELDIKTEVIKTEPMDDEDDLLLIESDPLAINTTDQNSAYITKKPVGGKEVANMDINKPQRKDKGKSRYTSYILWCREKRQQWTCTRPKLDFVSISREMGEMWKNVPSNEKYNWKRRAKRLNAKMSNEAMNKEASECYETSFPIEYNAGPTNFTLEQWKITENASAPDSSGGTLFNVDVPVQKGRCHPSLRKKSFNERNANLGTNECGKLNGDLDSGSKSKMMVYLPMPTRATFVNV